MRERKSCCRPIIHDISSSTTKRPTPVPFAAVYQTYSCSCENGSKILFCTRRLESNDIPIWMTSIDHWWYGEVFPLIQAFVLSSSAAIWPETKARGSDAPDVRQQFFADGGGQSVLLHLHCSHNQVSFICISEYANHKFASHDGQTCKRCTKKTI